MNNSIFALELIKPDSTDGTEHSRPPRSTRLNTSQYVQTKRVSGRHGRTHTRLNVGVFAVLHGKEAGGHHVAGFQGLLHPERCGEEKRGGPGGRQERSDRRLRLKTQRSTRNRALGDLRRSVFSALESFPTKSEIETLSDRPVTLSWRRPWLQMKQKKNDIEKTSGLQQGFRWVLGHPEKCWIFDFLVCLCNSFLVRNPFQTN